MLKIITFHFQHIVGLNIVCYSYSQENMPLMKVCAVSGVVDRTSTSNGSVRKTDIPSLGNCICTSVPTVTEVYSTPIIKVNMKE